MLELQLKDARELNLALDAISRHFGFWRALLMLLKASLRRRQEQRALALLDNATRRDIGLPEREVEPNVLWLFPWDGRL
jgi:uncharacterized protein YjiS (DUF1127 family)